MSTLRVGWLAYGVERPLSGVTRYALELGRALGRRQDCQVVYLTPYRQGPFVGESGVRAAPLAGCDRLPALMALGGLAVAVAAQRWRLDIVHDPAGIAPFPLPRAVAPFRRVVTVHDAIGMRFPREYPWLNTFLQRRYLPAMLPNVDAVITVGRHARSDLKRYMPRLPAGSSIVPPGVSGQFRPLAPTDVRPVLARLSLRQPYLLSVAARQERKNLRRVIDAFAALHPRFPDLGLALAGPTLWRFPALRDQVVRAGLVDSVIDLGYVADADLPAVYNGAAAFVFPSLYEGFGMPVLEAMACAVPVVCSNTSALPDTAGDAALLVDPADAGSIADGVARLLGEAALGRELVRRGLARASAFTWDAAADLTVAVYRQLAGAGRTAR